MRIEVLLLQCVHDLCTMFIYIVHGPPSLGVYDKPFYVMGEGSTVMLDILATGASPFILWIQYHVWGREKEYELDYHNSL